MIQNSLEKEQLALKEGSISPHQVIQKDDIFTILHALTRRKVQNKEIWKLLIQQLVKNFSQGTVTLRELTSITQDLYIIKIQSPKLYEIIVDYFTNRKQFTDQDLTNLGVRSSVNFIHAIACCHGELNNEAFFTIMRRYIMTNIEAFSKYQLIKLLDIYKFNVHFLSSVGSSGTGGSPAVRLKQLLESQLESKRNE